MIYDIHAKLASLVCSTSLITFLAIIGPSMHVLMLMAQELNAVRRVFFISRMRYIVGTSSVLLTSVNIECIFVLLFPSLGLTIGTSTLESKFKSSR